MPVADILSPHTALVLSSRYGASRPATTTHLGEQILAASITSLRLVAFLSQKARAGFPRGSSTPLLMIPPGRSGSRPRLGAPLDFRNGRDPFTSIGAHDPAQRF